ncbi:hypothetical protein LC612_25860, partial [Nostoc sp. CHAB 5834]|nr:hypothetical protein [Nostoc sp. CHAB 5834]
MIKTNTFQVNKSDFCICITYHTTVLGLIVNIFSLKLLHPHTHNDLGYEQLQQLIQNAERLHHEKQADLESKKIRIISGGGGRKPKLS